MKERLLKLLICPACHTRVTLKAFDEVKGWVRKANLRVTHFDASESGITAQGVREP